MTERYHAKVLLLYLHHYYLSNKWDKFVNYPVQQILEEAATILAQCHQPKRYVSYIYVRKSLDNIAQQVFECLKNEYPTHPILSISDEQFSFWKDNNINDNHWKNKEVKQILESLCEVLQNKLGFQNCGESAASFSLEYSCIDFVLKNKCGTGQLLGIIYHSVARRLGIHCDVKTGRSVFVCWKPKYGNIKSEDQKGFYIDVSHCDSIPNSNSSSMFNTTKMPIKLLSFDNYKNGCICYVPIIPRMRKYSKISVGTDTKAIKTKRTNENEIVIRLSPELTSLKNKIQKYLAECT
nr:PREDICTED: uncharacterized protein LOC105667961 isoform X2 [Linepithema humile]